MTRPPSLGVFRAEWKKFFRPSTTEQGYEFCASPMCRGEPPTGERRECCNCFDLVHVSCYFRFEELTAQGLDEEGGFDFHGKSCYFCTETLGTGLVRISPSPADVAVGCTGRPAESVQRGSFHVRPAEVVEVEGTPSRFLLLQHDVRGHGSARAGSQRGPVRRLSQLEVHFGPVL